VTKVLKAEVSVGAESAIVVESFVFGFNVLAEQSEVTKGMELVIEADYGGDLVLQRVKLE
jgi:Zn finger protein HypA/HybF involved in hydrogenase expression